MSAWPNPLAHRVRVVAAALLLASPAVVAFFSGGYFDEARLWAALAACALMLAGALVAPLPRTGPGWVAAGGLAGLAAWTGLSYEWAPLAGPVVADAQRLVLYLAAFLAAFLLLGDVRRAVEPALAAGCLVVIAYGLSERLAPALVELAHSRSAAGRLEQPLTYWNAMGALAALGTVLCARLAADGDRARLTRCAFAAGGVVLVVGATLSFSRGALVAGAAGLLLLCALVPTRAQVRAVAAIVLAGAAAALTASLFDGVRALEGSEGARQLQGAVVAALLALAMGLAAAAVRRLPTGALRRPRRALVAGTAVVLVAALAGALALERGPATDSPAFGADPARLVSTDSHRYAYWRVALDMAVDDPLIGSGAGGFRVAWRRERDIRDPAVDAHSLYLETLGELGLVGLALLGVLAAGIVLAARAALRADPRPAAGPIAVLGAWALHTGIDWDWEMPAVTLVALLCAGALASVAAATVRE